MTHSGHKVMFKKDNAYVVDSSRQIVAVGERQGNLYFVREAPESTSLVQTPPNDTTDVARADGLPERG